MSSTLTTPGDRPLRFLTLSGSLRTVSSTATLLEAAARLAPAGVVIAMAPSVGALPHFNPDLDSEGAEPPIAVATFRAALRAADGVLICCPEYIHGVPGAFKNALDWIASSGDLIGKPVALLNASGTSFHADAALTEILTVLMARVTAVRVPLRSNRITIDAILADATLTATVRAVIDALVVAARGEIPPADDLDP